MTLILHNTSINFYDRGTTDKLLEHNAAGNRTKHIVKHTSLSFSFFFLFSVPKPERTPVITRFGASNDSLTPVRSLPGSSSLRFSSDPGFRSFPAHEVSHLSSSHGQCEQTTHYPDRFPVAASGRVSRCVLRFVDNKKKLSIITDIFFLMVALFRRFPF